MSPGSFVKWMESQTSSQTRCIRNCILARPPGDCMHIECGKHWSREEDLDFGFSISSIYKVLVRELPLVLWAFKLRKDPNKTQCFLKMYFFFSAPTGWSLPFFFPSKHMQEIWVRSLDWEDPMEKEMATHSSTLTWNIPWTEKPGRPQSMGSQRVGHDWVTSLTHSFFYISLWLLAWLSQASCSGEIEYTTTEF